MRLTEWRQKAPARDAIDDRVMAVLEFLIADFGADPDPVCHVVWGDHPDLRYSVLVPAAAGLVAIAVRTAEGTQEARATARLIRWPKLALGEFSIEATGERRVVAVQVESFVLKGVDAEADLIAEFVRGLVLRADNLSAMPMTADLVKVLAESLGRIAIPPAVAPAVAPAAPRRAPAAGSRAAAPAAGRAAGTVRKAAPSPRPAPHPRKLPEEIVLRPAAVPAAHADMAPDVTPTAAASIDSMALVTVVPEPEPELAAAPVPTQVAVEPVPVPVPPAPPRKPRVPRPIPADAAAKPKRPRRVHRDWPEPAGAPGWDGPRPVEGPRAKKKPPRWVP